MPPVFGPSSPSWRRLWSHASSRTMSALPPQSAKTLTSRPVSASSTMISAPASPKLPLTSAASAAVTAAASSWQTVTPLPAASPEAFTTSG